MSDRGFDRRAGRQYTALVKTIRVGLLGFDSVCALDLVGPMDAFAAVSSPTGASVMANAYELVVIGLTGRAFVSDSGLVFKPHVTLPSAPALDTLIIPGGPGSRVPETNSRLSAWLRLRAPGIRRVASICTGIYFLAPTGLLDGRSVTTHWRYAADVARRFPKLNVEPDALFLKSDRFYTSAGITAGIDLSLALIEEDYGAEAALAVARELVVYLKRTGGQQQYSEPLRMQSREVDPFSGLVSWMMANLRQDLSVEVLAAHANLSKAHFSRLFKEALGASPADFVESLRLDEARVLLSTPNVSIKGVAAAVGFQSADAFRRSFSRRFGISPSGYRTPFPTQKQIAAENVE